MSEPCAFFLVFARSLFRQEHGRLLHATGNNGRHRRVEVPRDQFLRTQYTARVTNNVIIRDLALLLLFAIVLLYHFYYLLYFYYLIVKKN